MFVAGTTRRSDVLGARGALIADAVAVAVAGCDAGAGVVVGVDDDDDDGSSSFLGAWFALLLGITVEECV